MQFGLLAMSDAGSNRATEMNRYECLELVGEPAEVLAANFRIGWWVAGLFIALAKPRSRQRAVRRTRYSNERLLVEQLRDDAGAGEPHHLHVEPQGVEETQFLGAGQLCDGCSDWAGHPYMELVPPSALPS